MNRNKYNFYYNSKSLLAVCFAMLLLNILASGQYNRRLYSTAYENRTYVPGEYESNGEIYTCLRFLKDTTGRSNVRFKDVMEIGYTTTDSSFTHKRLKYKKIWFFNSNGTETGYRRYDSTGKCTDSTLISYDKMNKITRITLYVAPDSGGALTMAEDNLITRNSKGDELVDSIWKRKSYESYGENNVNKPFVVVTYNKYDENENCTSHFILRNAKDTEMLFSDQYDSKNRVIMEKHKVYNQWVTDTKKYDDSSNVIEENKFSKYDSSRELRTFDSRNRMLTEERYDGDKLKNRTTYTFNEDGSYSEYEEDYSGPLMLATCDVQEITTTLYDAHGNEFSRIERRLQGNDSNSKSDIHKYEYTFKGNIISDTEIIAEEALWHSSETMKIHKNKYDRRENLLEETAIGCQLEDEDGKVTYTYNAQNNVLEISHYTSCDGDTPYSKNRYIYYPDGQTLKEEQLGVESGHPRTDILYGEDSRVLKGIADKELTEAVMEYDE